MNNPFKNFKITQRSTFRPFTVVPGDTLQLTYTEKWTDDDTGRVVKQTETILLEDKITKHMTIDEAVAFTGQFENKDALGGMFLGKETTK